MVARSQPDTAFAWRAVAVKVVVFQGPQCLEVALHERYLPSKDPSSAGDSVPHTPPQPPQQQPWRMTRRGNARSGGNSVLIERALAEAAIAMSLSHAHVVNTYARELCDVRATPLWPGELATWKLYLVQVRRTCTQALLRRRGFVEPGLSCSSC